jgi:Zn-finger nucleic acid-binding protein
LDNVTYGEATENSACPRCKIQNLDNAQAYQMNLLQCKKCFGLFLKYETIQSILHKSHTTKKSKFQIDEDTVGLGAALIEFVSDIFLE